MNKMFSSFNPTNKQGAEGQYEDFTPINFADLLPLQQTPKGPKLQQALKLFRAGQTSATILNEIGDFIKGETQADDVIALRMHGEDFEQISANALHKTIYSCKKVSGMSEVIFKRLPVLLERTYTFSWKGILKVQPNYLILVPVTVSSPKGVYLTGVAGIVYNEAISSSLDTESTWYTIYDYLDLTLPLLVNVHKHEESAARCNRISEALQSLTQAEREIHQIRLCVKTIASEMAKFLNAEFVQVLLVQQELVEEKKFVKDCNLGSPVINKEKCPAPHMHINEEIKITSETCAGFVAINGKILRANQASDLTSYGIKGDEIHSIGCCIVQNILVVPITEHSGEAPLVIELSNKPGGFSHQDEEQAELFAKRAAAIISSSILLDYKKKAIRRHGIRNEVLANIGEISHFKVKQLLDLKFQYSAAFRKKLLDFNFTMRIFPDQQSPGIVLYMFIDLGFAQRWKMKKSTLIRFILSMQQGYRDIPYHNWKHACCVTHFAYLLLKKLDLVHLGYLTELEALTLIISCLAHDIDHRGRNNHFNLCAKSELYHLYKQEDSIMERHHIAVALSVLNTEDCNILQSLSDDEYREFLDLVQWNILATDLAKYLQNRYEYFHTLTHYDKTDRIHRKHLSAIIMTTADLCDNIKTWNENLPCVKSIFHEFFAQGDDEIALGLKPMPMMDRRVAYVPQIEIHFINSIVRPAYQAIADLLPQTRICLEHLDYFEDLWLVSTAVFDENAHLEDPLLILDLKDMREENLRKRSAPQLQNILTEHGINSFSIAQIATKTGSFTSLESRSNRSDEHKRSTEDKRKTSILLTPVEFDASSVKTNYCDLLKNYLCCYVCRNRGLVAARAVRKLKLATEYLEGRVNVYERRRSDGSDEMPEPHRQSQMY